MARVIKETVAPDALASAEEQDAEAQAQGAGLTGDKRVVRWYGQAGVDYREISLEDWKRAGLNTDKENGGVEAQAVRWDATNDYTVPRSFLANFLTDEQIYAWVERDSRFKIEDK